MIESYAFGRMTIAGHTYAADLMILPDGQILDNWWRQSGHRLCMTDIQNLINVKARIIIAGTGMQGLVRVQEGLVETLSRQGVQLITMKTPLAMKAFNRMKLSKENVAGCFHLTC